MDESLRERLRLIVSAMELRGPADRRQDHFSLRLADSPKPTPETMSRRGILKFHPLAKLISGKPALIDPSSLGLLFAPISNRGVKPLLPFHSVFHVAAAGFELGGDGGDLLTGKYRGTTRQYFDQAFRIRDPTRPRFRRRLHLHPPTGQR